MDDLKTVVMPIKQQIRQILNPYCAHTWTNDTIESAENYYDTFLKDKD